MNPATYESYIALLESLEVPEQPPRPHSKRTPERDIIDALCKQFTIPPSCKVRSQMAHDLASRVPLDEFVSYLSFYIAPFTHMFREVYDFLSRHRSTASSEQTIQEIRLGRRTRLPFDASAFEMVQRVQAEVIQSVWDVQVLWQLSNTINAAIHAAACSGESDRYGTCRPDQKALCQRRVSAIEPVIHRILAADQVMEEKGADWRQRLGPDLRALLEGFVYPRRSLSTMPSVATDCLHGQLCGQTDSDLYTQRALRQVQSILDQAQMALPQRVELLHKFLQLPLWRKRNDLYELWTLVRLCDEMPECNISLRNVYQNRWVIPGNKQGGRDKPVLFLTTPRGEYLAYTGWCITGPSKQHAMPDWLFCRQPENTPEFIVECKCGESYRLSRVLTDPMIKKYAPLLPLDGCALLLNYRLFTRSGRSPIPSLPRDIRIFDPLAPDSSPAEEAYRKAVRDFFCPKALRLGAQQPALDIVFAFDATSSMADFRPAVDAAVEQFLLELGQDCTDVRAAAIAIGDHADYGNSYLQELQPFTDDLQGVTEFIRTVPESTGGKTRDEAYEDALHTLVGLPWRRGAGKAVILIGDAGPNAVGRCPAGHDWEEMVGLLAAKGVRVFTGYRSDDGDGKEFYREVSARTGGQFTEVFQAQDLIEFLLQVINGVPTQD